MTTPHPTDTPVTGQSRPLLRIFLVLFINLTAFGIAIPILPALCKDMGGTGLSVGLLFTLQALGQFIMAPRWGSLSDRIGRKKTLLLTLLFASIIDLLTAFSPTLIALFVIRFCAGIFSGNVATASAYIADVTPIKDRSKGMAVIGIGFGLGFTFGPALGAMISYLAPDTPGALGVGLPFIVSSALNIIALIVGSILLKEPTRSSEERKKRRELFKGQAADIKPSQFLERKEVAHLTRFLVGYSIAVTIMETTLFYYMNARYQYDERQVGMIFASMGLLASLVQGGAVGRISRKIGDRKMMILGGIALGTGLLLATTYQVLWFLLAWLALAAIGRALTQPASLSMMSAQARGPHESGALMGIQQSANSAGRIIGPLVGGWLFDSVSKQSPFIAAGVVMLLSIAFWAKASATSKEAQNA